MAVGGVLRLLGRWLFGFLLFLLCVGVFSLFASWHSLPPKSVAIVREVWVREGSLFGPTALPFRIRVVRNEKPHPVRFLIQPPPFGIVEEVLPLQGEVSLTFRVPLWRKDTVTGNPYDGSVAFVGEVEVSCEIADYERFARRLDPLLARYTGLGQVVPLPSLVASEEEPLSLKKREDLLREIFRRDFARRMLEELGKVSQSLQFKLYFAGKVLEEVPQVSPSEKKIAIWKQLERYPWYKLEPQEMGKIVSQDTQIFERIMTYLRKEAEKSEDLGKLREEIGQYFSEYIAHNPQSYSQELWDYAIAKITETASFELKPETIRFLTYEYFHGRPALLENLLQSEDYTETLAAQYGVTIKHLKVSLLEDLASRYPELFR
ncbi:MAG: hypothetical protein H5U36_03245 [Candidatus Caldatribacterium sp.]|nr:hypothetical protein [Candidatus Caldatribacterium sp.]